MTRDGCRQVWIGRIGVGTVTVVTLSVVYSSVTSLTTLCSFSMSHPQFPVSVYSCFIYLYSLPPLTLP